MKIASEKSFPKFLPRKKPPRNVEAISGSHCLQKGGIMGERQASSQALTIGAFQVRLFSLA
jgi:hypothetical protein